MTTSHTKLSVSIPGPDVASAIRQPQFPMHSERPGLGDTTPVSVRPHTDSDKPIPYCRLSPSILAARSVQHNALQLRGFPECLDRPSTFPSVKLARSNWATEGDTGDSVTDGLAKLKIELDGFDESICKTLDEKDVRFVEEVLARLQYRRDLEQLLISRKRLKSSIEATERAYNNVDFVQRRAQSAGLGSRYRIVAATRRLIFMQTPFYMATYPYLSSYVEGCRRAEALSSGEVSDMSDGNQHSESGEGDLA